MHRVVAVGDAKTRLLLWELLSIQGVAEQIVFVDPDPHPSAHGNMGIEIRTVDWLCGAARGGDRVILGNDDPPLATRLLDAGWPEHSVLRAPTGVVDRAALEAWIARYFPDPIGALLHDRSATSPAVPIGVFGVGAGGIKVWEALMMLEPYRPAWFADNDVRRHGDSLFGLDVIAPTGIPNHDFAGIVIASMHRAPISAQLLGSGVARDRIFTPDVAGSVDRIRRQLESSFEQRLRENMPETHR